jgi:hypothetical protein
MIKVATHQIFLPDLLLLSCIRYSPLPLARSGRTLGTGDPRESRQLERRRNGVEPIEGKSLVLQKKKYEIEITNRENGINGILSLGYTTRLGSEFFFYIKLLHQVFKCNN